MGNMNPFDIIVLAILVLSAFWGGMRGVVSQIATIASWAVSWFIAARYHTVIASFLSISDSSRAPIVVVVTFFLCALAIRIGAHFVKNVVSMAGLKEFDRQAGALFGLFKGALICLLITFFGVILSEKTREIVNDSKSGPFFVSVIEHVQARFPDSELKEKFKALVSNNEEEGETEKEVETQIVDLKSYLMNRVLVKEAATIVKEADEAEKTGSNKTSGALLKSFVTGVRKLNDNIKESVEKDVADINEAADAISEQLDDAEGIKGGQFSNFVDSVKRNYASKSEDVYSYDLGTNVSSGAYVLTSNLQADYANYTDYAYGDAQYNDRDAALDLVSDANSYASSGYVDSGSAQDYGAPANYDFSSYADAGTYSASTSSNPYSGSSATYNGSNASLNYRNAETYSLATNGSEFGLASSNNTTGRSTRTTTRRRNTGRSASSVRLGSYSYSSNY